MPPNRRSSVSTLITRAPPAAYSPASSAGSGIVGQLALGRAAPLDLGDHADARRAQRRHRVAGRGRARRAALDLGEVHRCFARRQVDPDALDDVIEDAASATSHEVLLLSFTERAGTSC